MCKYVNGWKLSRYLLITVLSSLIGDLSCVVPDKEFNWVNVSTPFFFHLCFWNGRQFSNQLISRLVKIFFGQDCSYEYISETVAKLINLVNYLGFNKFKLLKNTYISYLVVCSLYFTPSLHIWSCSSSLKWCDCKGVWWTVEVCTVIFTFYQHYFTSWIYHVISAS